MQYEADSLDNYIINMLLEYLKDNLIIDKFDYILVYFEEIKIVVKFTYFAINFLKGIPTEGLNSFQLRTNFDAVSLKGKLNIIGFLIIRYILPYIINRIDDFLTKNEWEIATFGKKLTFKLFKTLKAALKLGELINFLIFLKKGDYPRLENKLLQMKYLKTNIDDTSLSFNYLMKKIIWSQLTKLFLFFAQLTGKSFFRGLLEKCLKLIMGEQDENQDGEKCSLCFKEITMIRSLKCKHNYCYYCLEKLKVSNRKCERCSCSLEEI